MNRLLFSPTLRTIAPNAIRSSTRQYSTPASSGAKSSNTPLILGLAALIGGGGGYYYWTSAGGKLPDPKVVKEKEEEIKAKVLKAVGAGGDAVDPSIAALSPKEFREFKLKQVIPYNDNTSTFVFELPEGKESGLTIASCLLTKGPDGPDGKPTIRPYTPVTAPDEKGTLDLLVKRYPKGAMTQYIHSLKPGDSLPMKGPLPKFPYKANEFETIGMVAGGSGITPMWQVLQRIDQDPEDKTKVVLIFANVEEKDILLRPQFEDLAKRKPDQFKFVFTLDKPPRGWKGPKGYITQELLATHLPPSGLADKIKIFVCGPPGQMEAISGNKKSPSDQGDLKGALADLGYAKQQVYKF